MRYRNCPWFFELGVAQEFLLVSLCDSYIDLENKGVTCVLAHANQGP